MKSNINLLDNPDKNENDFSQEKIIKLILLNFIEKTSLDEVINNIVNLSKIKDEEIKLKDKTPLSTLDVFSIIYKTCGSVKLFIGI